MNLGIMLNEVLRHILKKPATNRYPFQKLEMAKQYRGRIKYFPERCIGCMLCVRDCPSNAITIKKIGEKQFEAEIDLGKCIYCAQCTESCLKKALEFTQDIELAQLDRAKLKVTFSADVQNTTGNPA